MARPGILEKDVAALYIYEEDESCTHYLKCRIDKVAQHLGLTQKSLIEFISKKQPFFKGRTLYKLTTEGDMKIIN